MDSKIVYIFSLIIKFFIFNLFLFARTFTGLSIFGYRLGEYLIAGALILLIVFTIFIPIYKKKYFLDEKKLNFFVVFLVFSFFIINFLNNVSLTNEFIYKTSSYIWSFGGLVVGYYFLSDKLFKINNEDFYLSLLGLFIIYIFSTRGISENLQNFILNYTDKFEYPKGSDLLLAFIFIFYIFLKQKQFSQTSLNLLLIFGALYIPLLMVKSRSAFISFLLFSILTLPEFRKNIFKLNKFFYTTVILSLVVFILSTSWVVSRDIQIDEDISSDLKFAITSRYNTINDNVYEKEVLKLKLFYFEDGRIFSADGNLNWRLQIWQDIFNDMSEENNLFFGYGYDDIIPAMDSDQRHGQDGQNTNVHNYLMHILSRGGLLHIFLCFIIYYLLFKRFQLNNIVKDYMMIIIPLLFNSLFDPSMENAHYPIIIFLMIGLALNNRIIQKGENIIL